MEPRDIQRYEDLGRHTSGPLGQIYRLLSRPTLHHGGVEDAVRDIRHRLRDEPSEETLGLARAAIYHLEAHTSDLFTQRLRLAVKEVEAGRSSDSSSGATRYRQETDIQQFASALLNKTDLLLSAIIVPGAKTFDGHVVEAVALPWFAIVNRVCHDPDAIAQLDWRQWEEIIAGAYIEQGFDVVLTPRPGDRGRDIIATRKDFGSVRFFDQVKAYRPGRVVTAEEVRAMLGVLSLEPNVSKGIVTTTAAFAPGVMVDPDIARFLPYRLELKARHQLLEWLASIAAKRRS